MPEVAKLQTETVWEFHFGYLGIGDLVAFCWGMHLLNTTDSIAIGEAIECRVKRSIG